MLDAPVTLVVYVALGLLSIAALTTVIVKCVQFSRLGPGRAAEAEAWLEDHRAGRPLRPGRDAGLRGRVLRAIWQAATEAPGDLPRAEEMGRQAALYELGRMTSAMRVLEAAVQGAPMLGLLGTVIGMIDAFAALAGSDGVADPALLAGGIWTALATTALGLAIALVFYVAALWFEDRIERESRALEWLISAAVYGRATPLAGPAR